MARRAPLLAVLALSLATGQTTPAAAYPNGQIPVAALAPIASQPGVQNYLSKPAAAGWNTMRLYAAGRPDLYALGPDSAYRTYARQVYWRNYWCGRGKCGNAAPPGTSNHGWGNAIDLGVPSVMRPWIDAHGAPFGWRKIEAWQELWHVNYVGGFRRPDPGTSLRFPNLRFGSGGPGQAPAVREVERRLGLPQDGEYGLHTYRAVRRFQKAHRLPIDGKVGSDTWLKLRAATRRLGPHRNARTVARLAGQTAPMAGQDVRAVQQLLNARFQDLRLPRRVTVDGILGRRTINAIRRFQQVRRLPITGKADDRTYAELLKSLAPPEPKLTVSAEGTDLVASFEGFRACPYQDVVGVWTIGYGHTAGVTRGSACMSQPAAKALLRRDLDLFAVGVVRLVKAPVRGGQFNAVVSFSYNVGLGGLGGSTLLRLLNQRDYAAAARQFKRWNRAGGRVWAGLARRRLAECQLYVRDSDASVKAARPC